MCANRFSWSKSNGKITEKACQTRNALFISITWSTTFENNQRRTKWTVTCPNLIWFGCRYKPPLRGSLSSNARISGDHRNRPGVDERFSKVAPETHREASCSSACVYILVSLPVCPILLAGRLREVANMVAASYFASAHSSHFKEVINFYADQTALRSSFHSKRFNFSSKLSMKWNKLVGRMRYPFGYSSLRLFFIQLLDQMSAFSLVSFNIWRSLNCAFNAMRTTTWAYKLGMKF